MPISFRAACVLLAVSLLWPLPAAAEDLPTLTPPVPATGTDVPYPSGAEGDARVVLELIVEKDGSVSSATAVEGAEPFAEHARQAVLGWRFVPAQRGAVAVVARIRVQIFFDQPAKDGLATAPPPRGPHLHSCATTHLGVRQSRRPRRRSRPSRSPLAEFAARSASCSCSAEQVREMPGAFGDAFRAVEALPGLTPLVSGIPYFYVRGAPPNNTGYYIDGVKIPLLFHLGLGQGVIHPGLIDRVELFPSAAPARYGGSAGGIIVGQTREPAGAPRGEASLRLVDAGALLETPFADGRGSALVAGRYGYPGPILSAVSPDIAIGYWDYQARATWRLTARDTLALFAIGSHDYLASRSSSPDPAARSQLVEQFVSDFHRLDLRYDHATTGGNLRLAVTGGYTSQGAAPTYVTDDSLALRLEFDQRLTASARLRAGAEGQFDKYSMRVATTAPGEPEVPAGAYPPPTNLGAAVHTDVVLRLSPRVELVPGLRAEVFSSSRANEAAKHGAHRNLRSSAQPTALCARHNQPRRRLAVEPRPFTSVSEPARR